MTSPENTVHFRSEIQLRVVIQGYDQHNNPVGPERTEQLLAMPKPASIPTMIRTRDISGDPMFKEPPPPARELYLIEDFFDSIGQRLPSRAKAILLMKKVDHQRDQMNRMVTEHGERLESVREDRRNEIRRHKEEMQSAQITLQEATEMMERWRDFAVALDADRRARNFSVSKKCAALDPRNAGRIKRAK